jgi:hypothetical protein
MINPEIILNLWYVQDDTEIIYSLRARAYVGQGTDDEKLEFLQHFATVDYLIARPFPIPEAFHIRLAESGTKQAVAYRRALDILGDPLAIFEEAIRTLNADLPAQTNLEIPLQPLVCLTTLIGDDDRNIQVVISGKKRFT